MRESDIEKAFCEFFPGRRGSFDDTLLIGRQIKLPSGRADIVFFNRSDNSFSVVECKMGAITEAVVGQAVRYKHDIDSLINKLGRKCLGREIDRKTEIILVGTSIAKEVTHILDNSCACYLYQDEGFVTVKDSGVEIKLNQFDKRLAIFFEDLIVGVFHNLHRQTLLEPKDPSLGGHRHQMQEYDDDLIILWEKPTGKNQDDQTGGGPE